MSNKKIESRYVGKAVAPHLKLKGDEYLLDLSEEEALEMGISKREYEYVLKELESTNERIQSIKAEPNHELTLFDPENDVSEEQRQQVRASGRLTSVGQEEVGTSFFAPINTSEVRFRCRGNAAPTPGYTCKTLVLGVENRRTAIGSSVYFTTIDVPLAASNDTVNIYFSTTDSNGGVCDWQSRY